MASKFLLSLGYQILLIRLIRAQLKMSLKMHWVSWCLQWSTRYQKLKVQIHLGLSRLTSDNQLSVMRIVRCEIPSSLRALSFKFNKHQFKNRLKSKSPCIPHTWRYCIKTNAWKNLVSYLLSLFAKRMKKKSSMFRSNLNLVISKQWYRLFKK